MISSTKVSPSVGVSIFAVPGKLMNRLSPTLRYLLDEGASDVDGWSSMFVSLVAGGLYGRCSAWRSCGRNAISVVISLLVGPLGRFLGGFLGNSFADLDSGVFGGLLDDNVDIHVFHHREFWRMKEGNKIRSRLKFEKTKRKKDKEKDNRRSKANSYLH
jgi:hypothetical protein